MYINPTNSTSKPSDDFNVRKIFQKYIYNWQWFLLSVFVCFTFAYIFLRYKTPQYTTTTTILVKDEKKGGVLSELSAFSDLGLGNGLKSNVDNEIEILKSRTLTEKTVQKLGLNIVIHEKGNVVSSELYNDAPIRINFFNIKPQFYLDNFWLYFSEINSESFSLRSDKDTEEYSVFIKNKKSFRYGEKISLKNADFIITKNQKNYSKKRVADNKISIKISPLANVTQSYLGKLQVSAISKTSSVVQISLVEAVIERGEDFLNNLTQIYNEDAESDKNFVNQNTSRFINERLDLITKELDGVEHDVESFKTSNKLTDIESEAKIFIQGSNDYNKKSIEIEIQLNLVNSMLNFVKTSKKFDLIPENIISQNGDLSGLTTAYNQLVLERNRIISSSTPENPTIIKIEQQIFSLKSNLNQSLNRLQENFKLQRKDLVNQIGLLDTKIGNIPGQERQFRVIERQQKVKEELYLYLLQKREETAISISAAAPNARVIDSAKASKSSITPKKQTIYLFAFLAAILIPLIVIYIIDLFDNKVKNRFDITDKCNIPYLGDVPRSSITNEIIDTTSRTSTAEAIRIVRTNLDFMLNQKSDSTGKTIFLTSTIPKEGKTFLSINLASIFAISGKKVLLVGMDIRNPKLNQYLGLPKSKGLTDYLSTKEAKIEDYINKFEGLEEFDYLLSGVIPPNPTELLMSDKVNALFEDFRDNYDYIIVDTAPVSLVSDTLIVSKLADTFVYVVRANYLDKFMLNTPIMLYKENKLPNMAFILNDTDITKGYGYGGYGYGGYGYGGYGYGVTVERVPWYMKLFKK